jgi:hypothetical protein
VALGEALDKINQNKDLRHKMAENTPLKAQKYGYFEVPY